MSQSEALLRVAERLGRVGGWSIDVATRAMTLSTELRQNVGMTDDEPIPLADLVALFRPEFQSMILSQFERCAAVGAPFEHVAELCAPSGEVFWVRSVGEAEYDDGEIVRVRGATVDITAQRLAEKRLREQASLLDITTDAVVVRDLDGRITYWNRGAEQLYGWSAEEALGAQANDIVQEYAQSLPGGYRNAQVLAGGTWSDRIVIRRRDGNLVTVDLRITAVPDEDGAPRSVLSIATNVTERVETQERLEYALDAGGMGAWQFDLDTNTFWRSRQYDRLFGYDVPTLSEETPFMKHVVPEDAAGLQAAVETAVSTGRVSAQFRARRVDGEVRHIAIEGRGVAEADGSFRRLRGTIVDVTERVELEERLAQAQKLEAVGQLTGGIAHDFNNLLTVIIGSAELLNVELQGHHHLASLATMIQTAAEKGASLTQRLLAFGRRQMLRPAVVDASTIIRTMRDLLTQAVRENIELATDLTMAPCPIFIDTGQFEAALMNLCINASDAMPDGGRLTITTSIVDGSTEALLAAPDVPTGTYVRVVVTDDGIGMSHEIVERVFEPFFSTKDVGKGTGLGLPMVYGFLRQSGGYIRVDSTPGCGTSVVMFLPLAAGSEADRQAAERANVAVVPSRGESILVVEDDDLLRDLAVRLLIELGYTVVEASDGPSAASILRSSAPLDLLFTDVVMPGGLSGAQLADIAREARPGLPILFTSGYAQVALEGTDDQGADLLHKPYRRSDLATRIRAALEGHR